MPTGGFEPGYKKNNFLVFCKFWPQGRDVPKYPSLNYSFDQTISKYIKCFRGRPKFMQK